PARSSIVHGDYRLDNIIFSTGAPTPDGTGSGTAADDYRTAAVLDWELSTLGDPLADLGTLLTYWYDGHLDTGAAFAQAARLTVGAGFGSVDDLAERYARTTGADLSGLNYYRALGAMRLGVILEGVHARFL